MDNKELHQMIRQINYHHYEANPVLPSPEQIADSERERDQLIAKLKAQGKRVILVEADYLESCGRYVCEGLDGWNDNVPLLGASYSEKEI